MNQLPCGIIRDLLPLYQDGVCSPESREAVQAHLAGCAACREELEALRTEFSCPEPEQAARLRESGRIRAFGLFLKRNQDRGRKRGVFAGLLIAAGMILIAFYLLPLLVIDTGSGMFVLLLLIPGFCLCSGLLCGLLAGFQWLYPLLVALLFAPTIWIYYNETALPYLIPYTLLAALGLLAGGLIRRCREKRRKN